MNSSERNQPGSPSRSATRTRFSWGLPLGAAMPALLLLLVLGPSAGIFGGGGTTGPEVPIYTIASGGGMGQADHVGGSGTLLTSGSTVAVATLGEGQATTSSGNVYTLSGGFQAQCEADAITGGAGPPLDPCDPDPFAPGATDCNNNGIADICDIVEGTEVDLNLDGIPDSCECTFIDPVTCTLESDGSATISWGGTFSLVTIYRDGLEVFSGAGSSSYHDIDTPCAGTLVYQVEAVCGNGSLLIGDCSADFGSLALDFVFEAVGGPLQVLAAGNSVTDVDLRISSAGHDCYGSEIPTDGFSMAMAHDSNLLNVVDVVEAGALVSPQFFQVTTDNTAATPGWCVGVVYDFNPLGNTIAFGAEGSLVATATYETDCSSAGNAQQSTVSFQTLSFDPSGSPIGNLVVTEGIGYQPTFIDGVVNFELGNGDLTFVRGDCQGDGVVNLADAIAELGHLFQATPVGCKDACDSDDNGSLNLADPIYLLYAILGLGPMPPAPSGDCGSDPTFDTLECETSTACPDICPLLP